MSMDFATKFRGYVRTATPLIKVDTFDARATMRHIIEVMGETKLLNDGKKTMLAVTGISQWDISTPEWMQRDVTLKLNDEDNVLLREFQLFKS